ncbi:MAG: hypothetical protein KA260_15395, partial [Burkholderiales bacterium]|nr:hypothetical protein [Burkholderiales bacterium]
MKASIILDHMLKNELRAPTRKELKSFGHDLLCLYRSCTAISMDESRRLPEFATLEETSREILVLLSDFSETTRYHNLDALSSMSQPKDPLAGWNHILVAILARDVTEKRKARIRANAGEFLTPIADRVVTIMQGLDQQPLSAVDALALPCLHLEAIKHAVLYIVKLLCPLRDLIAD